MPRDDLIHGLHAVQAALEQPTTPVLELWLDARRSDRRIEEIIKSLGASIHSIDKCLIVGESVNQR